MSFLGLFTAPKEPGSFGFDSIQRCAAPRCVVYVTSEYRHSVVKNFKCYRIEISSMIIALAPVQKCTHTTRFKDPSHVYSVWWTEYWVTQLSYELYFFLLSVISCDECFFNKTWKWEKTSKFCWFVETLMAVNSCENPMVRVI